MAPPLNRGRLAEVAIRRGGLVATLDHSPHPSYHGPCCEVVARSSLTGRSRLISGLVNWAGNMSIGYFARLANQRAFYPRMPLGG